MRRHCHDCSGSVGHQNIIGNPDRNLLAVDRIDGGQTFDLHAGLLLGKLCSLKIRLLGCLVAVCRNHIPVFQFILVFVDDRMLRGYNHVSNTEQCIAAGRVYTKLILLALDGEIHLGALGFADPVLLGYLDALNIIYMIQSLDQLLGIIGNL